jgi:hypothetical protein
MTGETAPPKFLSLEFHARFFPRLLLDRLRRKGREPGGTTFTPDMEMYLVLAVCLVLTFIGLPMAWSRGSLVGWVLAALGVGGVVFLVIQGVASRWGVRPRYDDFLVGVFFFFVALGALVGIPVGMDAHSAGLGILAGAAGLAGGYLAGIFAGLALQRLGWIAVVIDMLAGLGAIILAGGALFLLLGLPA